MVEIALVFVGFSILVFFLLIGGAVYFIPRVLAEEAAEADDPDQPGSGGHHG